MLQRALVVIFVFFAACGPSKSGNGTTDGSGGSGDGGGDQTGCEGIPNCYSVYAHSDDTLYVIDLMSKTLQTVGKFNAPMNDTITDLAVGPDGTIYVISETALYTASGTDGHVTLVGSLSACGTKGVALTTLPNGQIWEGDFSGALCQIDTTQTPPHVGNPVHMGSGMALSGDLVAIGDGTVYGTAYKTSDGSNQGTQLSNLLVTIDMTSGAVTQIGATGYPKLFGVSVAENAVIGFTHDQTGHVVKIDPTSGSATVFATFNDPTTQMPISFAGAGVSPMVTIIQ